GRQHLFPIAARGAANKRAEYQPGGLSWLRGLSPMPASWVTLERHSKQADAPPAPPVPASVVRQRRETAPVWIVEAKATGALATGGSALDAVAEVHDTIAEPALLQQLQLDAGVAGECGLAFTDEHRMNEELALIDQLGV